MPPYDIEIDLGADGTITARHYAPDPDDALGATYVLAPGASVGHDSTFITAFGDLLSARGLDVVTFNFRYLERGGRRPDSHERLEACYRRVLDRVAATPALASQPILIGGKSMGGRIASQLAADPERLGHPVIGLICLGYPLHPPHRPELLRVTHLPDITVPILCVQGTRDAFGTPIQLAPVLSGLTVPVRIHRVMGGDHSFALPRRLLLDGSSAPAAAGFDEIATVIADWVRTVALKGRRG